MITDFANLGPSLRGSSDLGRGGKNTKTESGSKSGHASSFDEIFQKAQGDTFDRSDKDVRVRDSGTSASSVKSRADSRGAEAPPKKVDVDSDENAPRVAQREDEGREEPKSVKEKGKRESKQAEKESSREKAMLKFMDSMESEFGIPPTRIVEAMAQLPDEEMLSAPEDSASQVISQLDLPKDQEQKALSMYMGMLAQMRQAEQPMSPFAKGSLAAAAASPLALMDDRQRRMVLNSSLEQMNQKFFMKNLAAPETNLPSAGFADPTSQLDPADSFRSYGMDSTDMKAPPTNALSDLQLNSPAMQDMPQVDPNSPEGKQLMQSLMELGAAAAALDAGVKSDPKNAQALKAQAQLQGQQDPSIESVGKTNAMGMGALTSAALLAKGGDPSAQQGSSGQGGDFTQEEGADSSFFVNQNSAHGAHAGMSPDSLATTAQGARYDQIAAGGMAGGMMAMTPRATEADQQANLQQIMNQAQYMIKKGGGESRIQMNPEGLGNLHMKVMVNDGKVNLEMATESKEAKKLLESSINDLKARLGDHRLTVDHVKVDVGNQLASDNKNSESQNQQRQMDMRHDQAKNQAREFWSQFNGGGSGGDRGFIDSPGVRAYGGDRRADPLNPSTAGTSSVKRFSGSGKGRGLDLVA